MDGSFIKRSLVSRF